MKCLQGIVYASLIFAGGFGLGRFNGHDKQNIPENIMPLVPKYQLNLTNQPLSNPNYPSIDRYNAFTNRFPEIMIKPESEYKTLPYIQEVNDEPKKYSI